MAPGIKREHESGNGDEPAKKLRTVVQDLETVLGKDAEMKEEIEKLKGEVTELETRLETAEGDIREWKDGYFEAHMSLKFEKTKNSAFKKEIDNSEEILVTMSDDYAELVNKHLELENKYLELEEKNGALKVDMTQLKEENKGLKDGKNRLDGKLKKVEDALRYRG